MKYLLLILPIMFLGCTPKPTPKPVPCRYPKLLTYKPIKKPKITITKKGNKICMSLATFKKIRKYDNEIYNRFNKLNIGNILYNQKFKDKLYIK